MIKIIDNFLSETKHHEIENLFLKQSSLPWFLSTGMTYLDENKINKNFLRKEVKILHHHFLYNGNKSLFFDYIQNNFDIDYQKCINVRANLAMPSGIDLRHSRYHTDCSNIKNYITGIYYVNGLNSPTIFKLGKFKRKIVFPQKNRFILFDGNIEHAHYMPPFKERCVINFNFLL